MKKEGIMKVKEVCQIVLKGLFEVQEMAEQKIKELAKAELDNKEKKAQLDDFVIDFIFVNIIQPINFLGFDMLIEPKINELLHQFVPQNTQKIFDLMKQKFDL